LSNINRTQAAEITPGSDGMIPSAAAWRYLRRARSMPSLSGGDGSVQRVFVPGDLDLLPWHSNSSNRGTKHVFPVNLAQIRLAVPEIFRTQTKNQKCHRQR